MSFKVGDRVEITNALLPSCGESGIIVRAGSGSCTIEIPPSKRVIVAQRNLTLYHELSDRKETA